MVTSLGAGKTLHLHGKLAPAWPSWATRVAGLAARGPMLVVTTAFYAAGDDEVRGGSGGGSPRGVMRRTPSHRVPGHACDASAHYRAPLLGSQVVLTGCVAVCCLCVCV